MGLRTLESFRVQSANSCFAVDRFRARPSNPGENLAVGITHCKWPPGRECATLRAARRSLSRADTLYTSTIETLPLQLMRNERVTHGRSDVFQEHAGSLFEGIGLKDENPAQARRFASLLHDIWKFAVRHILNKPGN